MDEKVNESTHLRPSRGGLGMTVLMGLLLGACVAGKPPQETLPEQADVVLEPPTEEGESGKLEPITVPEPGLQTAPAALSVATVDDVGDGSHQNQQGPELKPPDPEEKLLEGLRQQVDLAATNQTVEEPPQGEERATAPQLEVKVEVEVEVEVDSVEVRARRRQEAAWREAEALDTVAGYRNFAEKNPQGPWTPTAEERTHPEHWRRHGLKKGAALQLAQACLGSGECTQEEVVRALKKALIEHPAAPEALLGLARIEYDSGLFEAAAERLQQVLDQGVDQPEVHLVLGKIFHQHGDCPGAIIHFDHLLALEADHVEALALRGRCRQKLGDCQRAAEDFRRVDEKGGETKFARIAAALLRQCTPREGRR